MSHFQYNNGELYAEQVSLTHLAKQFGTPTYVYSQATIDQQWQSFSRAFNSHSCRICYAVKANSNLTLLNHFAKLGAGFDIVSGGELTRVLLAGGKPENIVFSGVGKQSHEIVQALHENIFCFNVESRSELIHLNDVAKTLNKQAPISLRINPDIDTNTHPYIATGLNENKFGIPLDEALDLYVFANSLSHCKIVGVSCHLGSQIVDVDPYQEAVDELLTLINMLKQHGIKIQFLDLGGGFGISYHTEQPPTAEQYAQIILPKLKNYNLKLIIEPGRALVAEAGILLTRIDYLKHSAVKNFAIVDAAMNDLLRPALYDAWHGILPVVPSTSGAGQLYDIVGAICETGDFLGKNRHLCIAEGDLLAICTAGAYGFTMSSNYNSRPRAAEILVHKDAAHLIRKREDIHDLLRHETFKA